ncbi:MAG: hypothetical protein OTJ98_07440 [Dehalococcoidia bacterium]|nr:hypothetical protein [Dehalococcoidia bacterium]
MSDEQTAEAVIHRYAIDVKAFDASGKSFGFTVRNRRCWQCQQDLDEMEVVIGDAKEHMKEISSCCSAKPDYLLPGTPLTEAVFRLLLANGNKPMTSEEIRKGLGTAWSSVLYMKDLSDELLIKLVESENAYSIAPIRVKK